MTLVQSLWIGPALSTLERLSLTSFLRNGHDYHLYVYGDVEGVPDGIVMKDGNEVVASDEIFTYTDHDSYAGFSNLFRYRLLGRTGGYWVDTDVVCLRPFPSGREHLFAAEQLDSANRQVSSCVIRAPAGSEIMGFCYEESRSRDPNHLVWGETGPQLLTTAVDRFDMHGFVQATTTFCPVHWWQWERLIRGSRIASLPQRTRMALPRTRGVHLWNEMWRRGGVNKDAAHPGASIYERLKCRYL